jgi:heptosyltransferase-2
MRIAVLKPDHLGDLVLAAPAIAALQRRSDEVTLICHPETASLARHLFPDLTLQPVSLPHLDRQRQFDTNARPLAALRDESDFWICLRWDDNVKAHLDDAGVSYHASESDDLDVHVAIEQHDTVAAWTGPYDILASYVYGPAPASVRRLRTVGLCIAAGFPLNAWPLNHWLELARRMHRRNVDAVLVGGPRERARLQVLAIALADSTGRTPRILVGNEDFGGFLQELAEAVDLVIATDSGTAHLASLVRPVLSLFGGSPWRRFAPLGGCNAVVTRQLPCSPCPQFDRTLVNTCSTRECLANLTPAQVEACLDAYIDGRAMVSPRLVRGAWLACAPWEARRPRLALTSP